MGKSTWINGFINYISYSTLAEAESSELYSLIHTKFTLMDKDYNEITVCTGKDSNENYNDGQSSTQDCKSYKFHFENFQMTLIDTPGVGDVRGAEQDKINMQNILKEISHFRELHGICILMKPNECRINITFRYCIKELLAHLHQEASKNIMFCFTNSRGNFYRPGTTLTSLKSFFSQNSQFKFKLDSNTLYCYDSESYRYLAAVKNKANPVHFTDNERSDFSQSWDRAAKEIRKMIKHISNLPPHVVQSTLTLNNARDMILKLIRPMADISDNILTNRTLITDSINDLKSTEANIGKLKQKVESQQVVLKRNDITYPKTVCTNTNCKKVYGDIKKEFEYNVCHDHCYLSNISKETVGDEGLKSCACMANNQCTNSSCQHSYKDHKHIYYETYKNFETIVDKDIEKLILSERSAYKLKEEMIKTRQSSVDNLSLELKEIEKASIMFAAFLKDHALAPYNNEMVEYMSYLVKEEAEKVGHGESNAKLLSLQKSLESYKAEIKHLEEEMKKNQSLINLNCTDIENAINTLYSLNHSGKYLQETMKVINQKAKLS